MKSFVWPARWRWHWPQYQKLVSHRGNEALKSNYLQQQHSLDNWDLMTQEDTLGKIMQWIRQNNWIRRKKKYNRGKQNHFQSLHFSPNVKLKLSQLNCSDNNGSIFVASPGTKLCEIRFLTSIHPFSAAHPLRVTGGGAYLSIIGSGRSHQGWYIETNIHQHSHSHLHTV